MKITLRQTFVRYGISILLACAGSGLALAGMYVFPARVEYQIRERYTFVNPGPQSTFALGVLLPKTGPYQQVGAPQTTGAAPSEIRETDQTQSVLFAGDLPDGETTVEIAYSVTLRQGKARWDDSTTPADLTAQTGIEVDAPEIQTLAAQMPGTGEAAIFERFRYTARALDWPTGPRINVQSSAVTALAEGTGGCTEFSFLFTALNRAAGVPTRSISGLALPLTLPPFVETSATWSHPGGAHAWVEFYDGQQWAFGDASWASQSTAWQFFGRVDGSHLSYGEFSAELAAQQENQAWVVAKSELLGAMTAPLKFAAGSPGQSITFTPAAAVKKTWDGRWLNGLLGFVVMAALVKAGDIVVLKRIKNRV